MQLARETEIDAGGVILTPSETKESKACTFQISNLTLQNIIAGKVHLVSRISNSENIVTYAVLGRRPISNNMSYQNISCQIGTFAEHLNIRVISSNSITLIK